jgi:hypothetical protein
VCVRTSRHMVEWNLSQKWGRTSTPSHQKDTTCTPACTWDTTGTSWNYHIREWMKEHWKRIGPGVLYDFDRVFSHKSQSPQNWILGKYVPGHSNFGSMFLSFGLPNKQFFVPVAPEFFPKRQLEYFKSEYLWSQVTISEYFVEIVQYKWFGHHVRCQQEEWFTYVFFPNLRQLSQTGRTRAESQPFVLLKVLFKCTLCNHESISNQVWYGWCSFFPFNSRL